MPKILVLLSKQDFLYKIVINYLLSLFFMLFFHLYKIFFAFCCPIYNNVYNATYKKDVCQWNQRVCLWKIIMNELDFLMKTVII